MPYLGLGEAEAAGQLLALGAHHVVVLLEGPLQPQELGRREGGADALGFAGEGPVQEQALLGHLAPCGQSSSVRPRGGTPGTTRDGVLGDRGGVWGAGRDGWEPPRHRGDPAWLVSFPAGHGAEQEGKGMGEREKEKGRGKRHGQSQGRKRAGREMG